MTLKSITEGYSLSELEELVAQRRKESQFVAKWDDQETFINKCAALIMPRHQSELENRTDDLHEFYCAMMRVAFGNDYFDKLESLHGSVAGNGGIIRTVDQYEAEEIRNKVAEWMQNGSGKLMFSSTASVARAAYMEAIANSRGLTMYDTVEKSNKK
ncbi:hypothetical protein VPHF86_0183 [Vibrio phage F86]